MQSVTFRYSKSPPLLDILSLLSFALFLYPALMTVGTGLRWLEVPGTEWIKSYGAAEDTELFWLYFAAAVSCSLLFVMSLLWKSPARNYVRLDDVGLTTAFMGRHRRWLWRALEPVEVEQTGALPKTAKLTVSGSFGWWERLVLLFANGLASSSRVTIRLPDFYEVPVEEVAARINEYRAAALGETRPGEDTQRARKQAVGVPGQPVVFGMSTVAYRRLRIVEYIFYALALPLVGVLAYLVYVYEDSTWHDLRRPAIVFLGATIALWAIAGVLQKRALKPEYNSLRLDENGLTYLRAGKSRDWSWRELSAFELHLATSKLLLGRRRFITVAAPGADWTWHVLRRVYGLRKQPPLVIIEDVYETPLDEIAEMLNAYRDRALGDGSQSA